MWCISLALKMEALNLTYGGVTHLTLTLTQVGYVALILSWDWYDIIIQAY
jgi:hypothetical protein